jgi:hypothetical protein
VLSNAEPAALEHPATPITASGSNGKCFTFGLLLTEPVLLTSKLLIEEAFSGSEKLRASPLYQGEICSFLCTLSAVLFFHGRSR